jgi:glycosyltransferase involved in cell wall biosynthesis
MMRVAYVCADPGIPVWGNKGCSIHVQEVLRALVHKGCDCHLVALKGGGDRPLDLEPATLHLIDGELPKVPARREQALLALNERVTQLLDSLAPFDFIYERYSMWAYAGVEFARREGIPGLLEVNAPLIEEQAKHRSLTDRGAAIEATRRAFRAAAAVLPVSDDVAAFVRSYGVARDRIHVLPNAVNPTYFDRGLSGHHRRDGRADSSEQKGAGTIRPGMVPLPTSDRDSNSFTIGFVGTLKPWHGVDQLIKAFAHLATDDSTCGLKIAGDGPDRDRLESLARSLPAPIAARIEFLGMLPHSDIPKFLATLDAAVSPGVSSDAYFSPLKLFEYMAAGLPIVAARCGQVPSLIRSGTTGLVYNPGDSRALASALRSLRNDTALSARLGNAARRDVLAHHTWQHRCESILDIVRQSTGTPQHVAIH